MRTSISLRRKGAVILATMIPKMQSAAKRLGTR